MLCSEDEPLAGIREKETLGKCMLLSDCPARQKNRFGTNNGTNHYSCIFCGGWSLGNRYDIYLNDEVHFLEPGPFMHNPPSP